jgi:glycosyltransferase involved in cell wall biosynthesis
MEASSDFSQPVDLVIAGKDGWKLGSIHRALALGVAFKGEGGSRLHRIQSILDDDRRDLLLAAEVVALPSWHEGFGLVALEAMQAGTAVIVSEEGGMKEIVGETGIVLPPWDISAWSAALVGIMQDAEARQSLAREGMSRSQGFTWDRVARIVVERLTESV